MDKAQPVAGESPDSLSRPAGWVEDAKNAGRGFLMGLADVVPGVSGGTVALIVGIYERLVSAISRVDSRLWSLVARRQWGEAARHLDLRFLLSLAVGIAAGFGVMTVLMSRLLSHPFTFMLTFACFFGLILASSVLVGRMVAAPNRAALLSAIVLGVLGAAFAYLVISLPLPRGGPAGPPGLPYLFLCGAIGICAMILPGISGAMLLLMLGVYAYLTDIPRSLLHGEEIAANLAALAAFGSGAALGLLSFSKILKWLLARYHAATMAVLCGFMIGALPKIWPFQRDTTPEIEKFKYKVFEASWPESAGAAAAAIAVALAAMLVVFTLDRLVGAGSARPVPARSVR